MTTCSASGLNAYDLWDFGAGANSMQFAVDEIGARRPLGLNLTVDATRHAEMRDAGFATREMGVLTIPDEAQTD
jgi:hypothetical protein